MVDTRFESLRNPFATNATNDFEWGEQIEEQQIVFEEEFIDKKCIKQIKKKLDKGIEDGPVTSAIGQIRQHLKDHWEITLPNCVIKKYDLSVMHSFKIRDEIPLGNENKDGPVCIIAAGSSITLQINKEFPPGSGNSVLHSSVVLLPGSALKLEDSAVWDCEYYIPKRKKDLHDYSLKRFHVAENRTESVYLLYYY